jgi:hypothetical protein
MPSFWFHYNKPASRLAGHPVLTVHHRGQCMLVRGVVCMVPVRSRERRQQPRIVMAGNGVVTVSDGTAYITEGR